MLRPGGALQPLLWPCGGFCVREWRVLGLLVYLVPAELGGLLNVLGFEAWQTAALNAYKKPLLQPWGALEPLLWPWTPIRNPYSHCCGRGVPFSHCCGLVVAFACRSGACWACWCTLSLRSWADFWNVLGFEAWQTAALNAYKKPLLRPGGALQPLLWPCGGFCVREWRVLGLLVYLVPAELGGLLECFRVWGLANGSLERL